MHISYMYYTCVYIYTESGRNGGNQISECGISHCKLQREIRETKVEIRPYIRKDISGPFRYARDAYIDISSNLVTRDTLIIHLLCYLFI